MNIYKQLVVACAFSAMCGSAFADASRYPYDVSEFLANREACDHFRGEVIDPPDAELKQERDGNIKKFCTGTEAQLTKLKKKYSKRKSIMKQLNELEPNIEAQ